MRPRVAWVLNLDAELELIDPDHEPSARQRASVRERALRILPEIRAATRTEPVLVDGGSTVADVVRGETWCPTPRALARLAAAGVTPPDAPAFDVVRRVNHRSFAAAVGPSLPGACFARSVDDVERAFARRPDAPWLLKRPFGFSGRMRKVVVPARRDRATDTWIAASMTGYGRGLAVEPLVDRCADFALHGRVHPDGAVQRGAPVASTCDARGVWLGHRRAAAGELAREELESLVATFAAVARALAGAGWFGPFGIDAFRWRDDSGVTRFHPLSEINARYSMAWWCGMSGAL